MEKDEELLWLAERCRHDFTEDLGNFDFERDLAAELPAPTAAAPEPPSCAYDDGALPSFREPEDVPPFAPWSESDPSATAFAQWPGGATVDRWNQAIAACGPLHAPLIHPAPLPAKSSCGKRQARATRARKAARAAPATSAAARARAARTARRAARARGQVVRFVGGGDVGEICRCAVADAGRGGVEAPADDFLRGVDPRALADLAFRALVATCPSGGPSGAAEDGAETAAATPDGGEATEPPQKTFPRPSSPKSTKDDLGTYAVVSPPTKKPPSCVLRPSLPAPPSHDSPEVILESPSGPATKHLTPINKHPKKATPKARDTPSPALLETLPTGKDPESRRLRRLMRNRHSAQASRDRRRRALEEQRRLRETKEDKIRALERAVGEEAQYLMQLEEAVALAKECLGHAKYSKVAAGFCAGEDGMIVQ